LLRIQGARVRAVRGHRSQEEFAAVLGVSRSSLLRTEMGERPVGHREIEALKLHFGCSASWLLHGEGEPPPVMVDDTQPSPPAAGTQGG
jgi:transcriptional regulator with XRE-family HTH domain